MVATDDADAIARLHRLLIEFATLRKSKSLEEIASEAAKSSSEHEETEPAKAWRRFLAARYRSDRNEIERLIMPHPDAAVLWRGAPTPPGIVKQLTQISDSYVVSIVAGSVESGHVRLATELGIMDAHLVDGSWRIDASSLIEFAASRDV